MRVHAVLAAAAMMALATPAAAQVLDATYRGTMLCDKLPFTNDKMREAIEVTISGGTARYSHVVRLSKVDVEFRRLRPGPQTELDLEEEFPF